MKNCLEVLTSKKNSHVNTSIRVHTGKRLRHRQRAIHKRKTHCGRLDDFEPYSDWGNWKRN